MNDISRARQALIHLDPSCSREEWIKIGMAAKSAGLLFEDFHDWSKAGSNYKNEKDCKNVWDSFDNSGSITAGTLFYLAHQKGWVDSKFPTLNSTHSTSKDNDADTVNSVHSVTNLKSIEIWEKCLPAFDNHEYILRKKGTLHGLRYYPDSELPLIINGRNVTNYLVVPCWSDDELQTLQFIPPKKGEKLNLPGASFNNGYFIVGVITNIIYLCEGIGHAWAINKASGCAAVVCFGAYRMLKVAKLLRTKYPDSRLVIIADRGTEKLARDVATSTSARYIELPKDKPEKYDVNDYLLEHGEDALREILANPRIEMPLNVIFADELPEIFIPADELIEGVFIAGDGSILYGDTNCGKTFVAIDIGCSVARGADWMGRKTESGLVIYLAAESPSSVQRRLQAYQKHYDVRVPNFAVVQNPVNLFDGETDTDAIIHAVHILEKQCRQKARLIIGDTLARLSAGANENAGQDMGLVVRHFDRIRNECNAHFMLIHHSGKNAAAGARGWSGVRAAVDTEIEVTDSLRGRCIEITKQRDLSTKGIRIGFRLETVTLGQTKWKSSATSCVVMPTDAPLKNTGKRLGEIGGAITEYLTSNNSIKKCQLVKHFNNRYKSCSIYRELKKMVSNGQLSDSMGYVRILVPNGAN